MAPAFDAGTPSMARVYDYLLGGKDHFAADRRAAEDLVADVPEVRLVAQANRAFLVRAVRHLASAGIRQYLDLGSGLPTSPNVHEIARHSYPDARVVYVDCDPIVVTHGKAFSADDKTAIICGNLCHPDAIFDHSGLHSLIDFTKPVAVLAVAVLHFLDDHASVTLVSRFRGVMAPGSYLVVSHGSHGTRDDKHEVAESYRRTTADVWVRTPDQIRAYLTGLDLVKPGLVPVQDWRPDSAATPFDVDGPHAEVLAAVAHVPGGRDE